MAGMDDLLGGERVVGELPSAVRRGGRLVGLEGRPVRSEVGWEGERDGLIGAELQSEKVGQGFSRTDGVWPGYS